MIHRACYETRRGAHPLLAALALALLASCASIPPPDQAAQRADTDSVPPPHRTPHRAHIEGDGPRTIILEAGLGDTLEVWKDIQPMVAERCMRTLSYNRAGYAGSDGAMGTRDARTIVEELRGELEQRAIAPPYVLVGHSLGGLYMQYFARNYPEEVAGLVLVDSTHWNQRAKFRTKKAPGPYASLTVVTYMMNGVERREFTDSSRAGEQVNASPPARQFPTVVLSSTRVAPRETAEFREMAMRLQEEIAADFPAARHIRVEGSGHYIQRDRPAVLVDAIREVAGCAGSRRQAGHG